MKRKAILIGNTTGLEGVKVDISRYANFLESNAGGAWYSSEIEIIINESKANLLKRIDKAKNEKYDFVFLMYSGHGGQLRQTVLEINGNGELIPETDLRSISTRQLNIYDCCRAHLTEHHKIAMDSLTASFSESRNPYRRMYDERIMQAIHQQALLYSCSIGQVSYDTPTGGVYSANLLKAARTFATGEKFKLVSQAHQDSIAPTYQNSINEREGIQIPEAIIAKCLSVQQLIISLNV